VVAFARVPAHALPERWRSVGPLVALACARSSGKFEPADVARAVAEERFQLWVGSDAADPARVCVMLLTRLMRYPGLLACELLACVGDDRPDWEHHLETVEAWARAQGCGLMQPIARPGWERVLARRGYRKTHVMLEKKL
jgi:hypothetical protein